MNELINLRDAALRLFGGDEVLNGPDLAPATPADNLPAALASALRALKSAAVGDDGARVDYAALGASPAYGAYQAEVTARLPAFDPASLREPGERLAFWINLYNALVIDGVVSYGVRGSVRAAAPALGFFRRIAYDVGGRRVSAEDIEHGILRANAGNPFIPGRQFAPGDPRAAWAVSPIDPRIHCALNCASRSCPPIAAYDAARIEAQLELAARAFVGGDVEVDAGRGALRVSQIFGWYRDDFGGPEGVVRFLGAHLPDDARRRWLEAQSELDLELKPYDWRLNA